MYLGTYHLSIPKNMALHIENYSKTIMFDSLKVSIFGSSINKKQIVDLLFFQQMYGYGDLP